MDVTPQYSAKLVDGTDALWELLKRGAWGRGSLIPCKDFESPTAEHTTLGLKRVYAMCLDFPFDQCPSGGARSMSSWRCSHHPHPLDVPYGRQTLERLTDTSSRTHPPRSSVGVIGSSALRQTPD